MRRLCCVLGLTLALATTLTRSGEAAAPPAPEDATKSGERFTLTKVKTLADLQRLEARVQYVISRVSPAVVGLGGGSAVVVSSSGTLLTVAHVGSKAGRPIELIFHDGKKVKGKTLGNWAGVDAGMAQITEPATYPSAEMGKSMTVKPGNWVVTMGYPVSFSKGMKPPVRLGRVQAVSATAIVTDCPMMGGDSGGPVFDMDGRVIGQNSRTAGGITGNVHVPVDVYLNNWARMTRGEDWNTPRTGGGGRRGSDDEDDELYLAAAPPAKAGPAKPRTIRSGPYERNHDDVRLAFREATLPLARCTVRVLGDDRPIALGTIVTANGLIVTKASQLKGRLEVRLFDGTLLRATKVGEDRDNDFAVLRVEATGLTPVRWRADDVIPQGNMVAAVGEAGEALAVGTVTSEPREFKVNMRPATPPTTPYLGVTVEVIKKGVRLREITRGSAAEKAGLKAGDVVRRAGESAIRTQEDLRAVITRLKIGDALPLVIRRGDAEEEFSPILGKMDVAAGPPPYDRWGGGPFSERRFGFGKVLPHDTYLQPADIGGPIVDTSGRVVGVNIARSLRISTYALLPMDVERLVAKIAAKGS
jgi:serine protease Do